MSEPKYRCGDCKLKHKNVPDRRKKLEDAMACRKPLNEYRHQYLPEQNNIDNPKILYKQCIGNYYNGYYASLINIYGKYSEGLLPYSGSLYEQPAKFVECMNIIYNLISENDYKKAQRESNIKKRTHGK